MSAVESNVVEKKNDSSVISAASSSGASEHAAAATQSTTAGHDVIETFTLVVENFHKYANQKDTDKYFSALDLGHKKTRKVPHRDMVFVTFMEHSKLQKAKTVVEASSYKNKKLTAFEKTGKTKFIKKKRERDDESGRKDGSGDREEKRRRKTGRQQTAPWHDVPYSEQLARKEKAMRDNALVPLLRGIKKLYKDSVHIRPSYLGGHLDETLGLIHVEPIIPSPQQDGYRNKCEFTFGCDASGLPSLGFRVSSFDEGTIVDPPTDAPTVPNAMRTVVGKLVAFVRASPLPCFDLKTHSGVWRLCTIRYSRRTGELHVLLCVKLADIDGDQWAREVDRLRESLESIRRDGTCDAGDDADPGLATYKPTSHGPLVTGCGYQAYDGASVAPVDLPVHHIFGRATVREKLLGATFEIAPTAFFQVRDAHTHSSSFPCSPLPSSSGRCFYPSRHTRVRGHQDD